MLWFGRNKKKKKEEEAQRQREAEEARLAEETASIETESVSAAPEPIAETVETEQPPAPEESSDSEVEPPEAADAENEVPPVPEATPEAPEPVERIEDSFEPEPPAPPEQEPIIEEPPEPAQESEKKKGFFSRLASGLARSSNKLSDSISGVFVKRKLDDDTLEELEDILITSDLGAKVASRITTNLAKDRFDKEISDEEIKLALATEVEEILTPREVHVDFDDGPKPRIVLFVGVNGSGKTTTIGKIASNLKDQGAKALLVAGDTFRAAAIEQLTVWGERAGIPVLAKEPGADAAGLVYEAVEKAKAENLDLVLVDTAGRLQNRSELMDELSKIIRVTKKLDPEAPHDVFLVLDATVGQNALSQVEAFRHTAG